MENNIQLPRDQHGALVNVGSLIRVISLSGKWLDEIPPNEKIDVLSMVGSVFAIEEIDQFGQAWIHKTWTNPENGTYHSHSIALTQQEMELIDADVY